MTFVLGDKLAGVTRTLQLVNLGGPGGHLGSEQEMCHHGHSWGLLPAPCPPGGVPIGGTGDSCCALEGPWPVSVPLVGEMCYAILRKQN